MISIPGAGLYVLLYFAFPPLVIVLGLLGAASAFTWKSMEGAVRGVAVSAGPAALAAFVLFFLASAEWLPRQYIDSIGAITFGVVTLFGFTAGLLHLLLGANRKASRDEEAPA